MNHTDQFHNPYHFIPVKPDHRPDDMPVGDLGTAAAKQVTHDRYLAQPGVVGTDQPVFSGRIVCRMKLEDPLVLGGKREQLQQDAPYCVHPFELGRRPAIPASSIRGLISSLAEAASNSALRVLPDAPFSRRAEMHEANQALGMIGKSDDNNYVLVPLALPAIRRSPGNKWIVPNQYRTVFPNPRLRVFVGSYTSAARGIQVEEESFLGKRNPDSFSFDEGMDRYWYIKLGEPARMNPEDGSISVNAPHIGNNGLLTGMNALSDPISQGKYDDLSAVEKAQYKRGILRVLVDRGRESEMPGGKTKEIFVPFDPDQDGELDTLSAQEAVEAFHDLVDEREEKAGKQQNIEDIRKMVPYHLKGTQRNEDSKEFGRKLRLKIGDIVFFTLDPQNPGRVAEISVSSIWRKRAGGTSHEFFGRISTQVLPFNPKRSQISIAEQMFGFVEKQGTKQGRSLAGRLRFSFGLLPDQFTDPYDKGEDGKGILLKILACPKPPSPPFYFKKKDGSGEWISKRHLSLDLHQPQGRKYYLHRGPTPNEPWRTNNTGQNLRQKNRVTPLREGLVFYFHVNFDNLSMRELGLLCYALQPFPEFHHKLGLGKPLGLGKVKIEPLGIYYVNRPERYEKDSLFSSPRYHYCWRADREESTNWHEYWSQMDANTANSKEAVLSDADACSFPELRKHWEAGMDPDIKKAIELLGNAESVKLPVHTPQLRGVDIETETYKWFVENDKAPDGKGQHLEPLDRGSPELPHLTRNEPSPKGAHGKGKKKYMKKQQQEGKAN